MSYAYKGYWIFQRDGEYIVQHITSNKPDGTADTWEEAHDLILDLAEEKEV